MRTFTCVKSNMTGVTPELLPDLSNGDVATLNEVFSPFKRRQISTFCLQLMSEVVVWFWHYAKDQGLFGGSRINGYLLNTYDCFIDKIVEGSAISSSDETFQIGDLSNVPMGPNETHIKVHVYPQGENLSFSYVQSPLDISRLVFEHVGNARGLTCHAVLNAHGGCIARLTGHVSPEHAAPEYAANSAPRLFPDGDLYAQFRSAYIAALIRYEILSDEDFHSGEFEWSAEHQKRFGKEIDDSSAIRDIEAAWNATIHQILPELTLTLNLVTVGSLVRVAT